MSKYQEVNPNPFKPEEFDSDPITGYSFDLTYKLNNRITLYSQFAQLIGETRELGEDFRRNLGFGIVPIGISGRVGPIDIRAEFRKSTRNFIFNYWDRSYDIQRAVEISDGPDDGYYTKESSLANYGRMHGL